MNDQLPPATAFQRELRIEPDPAAWAGAPVLLLTACDGGYLPHALALARSLDAVGAGHLLLHLVNPRDEDVSLVRQVARSLRTLRLHLSTEQVSLPDAGSLPAYYASARFLRMAELLADPATRVPLFALDADALAVAPLTLDFSDKPEAEICLRRRDLKGPVADHLRVAAGAVWARDSDGAAAFMHGVAESLRARFAAGDVGWFVDQLVLLEHIESKTGGAQVRNLKTKFSDWMLSENALVWTGKGDSKYLDIRYLMLRHLFDEDPARRDAGRRLMREFAALMPPALAAGVEQRLRRVPFPPRPPRCAVFLPRLDLPWKRSGIGRSGAPVPAEDTVQLRLWWKRFTMELARILGNQGAEVVLVEIPAWEITPERVDAEDVDLAFIPHRCSIDFGPTRTPRWFYMQEYFRPVFVLDPQGWSAASSVYPLSLEALPEPTSGAWEAYRGGFESGRLDSKFHQSAPATREELEAAGLVPRGPYIFHPLQVPHDQSIRYFSDVDQEAALEAVAGLSKKTGLPLVLKEHPANRAAMKPFREKYDRRNILWSEAHVHDLARHSAGVVVINSGVGFEALFSGRPVVCLGRAEYDVAAHRATPATLAEVWSAALAEPAQERERRHARFVDWFLGRHAIDMSRPVAGREVLERHVAAALASITAAVEVAG